MTNETTSRASRDDAKEPGKEAPQLNMTDKRSHFGARRWTHRTPPRLLGSNMLTAR